MNQQFRDSLDAYYRDAQSWGRDREDALRSSRRIAWIVAAIALAVAILLAVALVVLLPLKTVQTHTLLVDRHTGFVQALDPLIPSRISGDAALTQSFLGQYVIARESFDSSMLQGNYRRVATWSGESARRSYLNSMQASSPESPLARYPRTSTVEVRVKSVAPVTANVAMVRFDTIRTDMGGHAQPPQAWVSLVRYRYTGEPMRLEERFVNPLGFQVVRYRRDQEALPPGAAEQRERSASEAAPRIESTGSADEPQ